MSDRLHKALANPQAELALLASALRASPEQRAQMAAEALQQESWFTGAERVVACRVMREMIEKSLPVDLTLLKDGLRAHLADPIADQFCETLAGAMPTASLWIQLAEKCRDYYVRRQGVEVAEPAKQQFVNLATPAGEALESAESGFFALHSARSGKGMRHVSASLHEAYASIEESMMNRGYVTGGMPTGFTDLDRFYIKGMRPGHVIMLVAPPGGGKTVAMMKLCWNRAAGRGDYDEYENALMHAAQDNGKHQNYLPCEVGVFTLEMDDVQLTERLLITQSRVEIAKMQRGQISRKEQDELGRAHRRIVESKLFFEFVPGIAIQELRVKARYAVMRHKLKMIAIDYAQLITSNTKAARGNRTQEMVDVSKGLKLLAQECNVPVVVLAQPKQETWGMRAGLNAMAETAQLAKDADLVVMFGFWDKIAKQIEGLEAKTKAGVTGENEEEHEDREPDDPRCFAYADIVKNRHGGNTTGSKPIKLFWERDFFDFVSTNRRLFDSTGKEHQQ